MLEGKACLTLVTTRWAAQQFKCTLIKGCLFTVPSLAGRTCHVFNQARVSVHSYLFGKMDGWIDQTIDNEKSSLSTQEVFELVQRVRVLAAAGLTPTPHVATP